MTEMSVNHELQCLSSTGGITRDHRSPGHDRTDLRSVRIEAFCGNLQTIPLASFDGNKSHIPDTPDPWP